MIPWQHHLFPFKKLDQDAQLNLAEKSFLSRNSDLCQDIRLLYPVPNKKIFANPSSENLDIFLSLSHVFTVVIKMNTVPPFLVLSCLMIFDIIQWLSIIKAIQLHNIQLFLVLKIAARSPVVSAVLLLICCYLCNPFMFCSKQQQLPLTSECCKSTLNFEAHLECLITMVWFKQVR